MRRLWQLSHRSLKLSHQYQGSGLVTLDVVSNAENVLQSPWRSLGLLLVFRLGAILGIMVLLVTVIARDCRSIPFTRTIPTPPLWSFLLGFFLGFSNLASVGLGGVILGGIGLRDILLTLGGASLSMPSTHLFSFSLNSFGGF